MESEWGIYANRCTIQVWIKKTLNRTGKKAWTASERRVWKAWKKVFEGNTGYSDKFGRLTENNIKKKV